MEELTVEPSFIDRSELFKSVAASIEQKHIRRHNEKPGVSRRDENRPSPTFITICNVVLPLATELYLFRKMLDERAQDYIFATPSYSKMTSEERETFDGDVREKLSQFESFINQLGHRVNSSEGLRNATERNHLLRVHEGLRDYLKESVDFVSLLRKEHLKRVQAKNRSLAVQVNDAIKDGHVFKYQKGLEALVSQSDLNFNDTLVNKLEELKVKHKCIQYTPQRTDSEERDYDLLDDVKNEKEDGGWDGIDELEDFDEVLQSKKISQENRASPILFQESVRKRAVKLDPEQEQLRDSYERWKDEQGAQFVEQFQQQAEIIKEEFVKADRDDEIEKLEQQITEIQSLSSVFAEKIMDQERDIDLINDLALHTTENLIDGNEWIRQAITNSAVRRVILLFCIVVLTFTLLFLDWYNP
uniref:t-SNARE coiled-coil homology domain-containing protein n=1 Tax=Caenorhabditis japonica TaxID=281687 RepID=A0A8R1HXI8_CAEJA